jgi:ABC-type transport system involved in cytochrome c biogenesis permease subunit
LSQSPDIIFFWIAFWFYLAGFIAFSLYIPFRAKVIGYFGGAVMSIGFIPHTIGFFLRWYYADHVPLSNMYEYMSLMSWMAVLSLGILVFRYKKPLIGSFIAPLVFMLMVTASMLPKEISKQLVPALQSYWLTIHVTLAALGSGAFAVATAVSFVYLLKSNSPATGNKPQSGSKLYLPGIITMFVFPFVFYVLGLILGLFPIASDLVFTLGQSPIAGMGGFFIALGMFLPLGFIIWSVWHTRLVKSTGVASPGARLVSMTFAAFLLGSLIIGLMVSGGMIHLTQESVYKIFEFLGMAYVMSVPVFFILWFIVVKTGLLELIPMNLDILDEINYKAVALGYPLYTVGALFAGAIWAEKAWGQFWGWDPKEVGSLIIWLFYSGFLHARYQHKWKGNRAAILSLCGFGMILLSFFGNYFFGGQHTYA